MPVSLWSTDPRTYWEASNKALLAVSADLRLMLRCRPSVGFGVLGRGMGSLSAPRRWPRLSWITWRMLRTHSCFSSNDDAFAKGDGAGQVIYPISMMHLKAGKFSCGGHKPSRRSCCRMLVFVQPRGQIYRDPPRCALLHRALKSDSPREKRGGKDVSVTEGHCFHTLKGWWGWSS